MAGSVVIQGLRTGLPGGNQESVGPWSILCSVSQDTNTWVVNTSSTIPIATSPAPTGVLIIPPASGSVALTMKFVLGDTGTRINPGLPTLVAFDAAAVPSNLYLTSASSVAVVVQFL